jgi:hypothetical protein
MGSPYGAFSPAMRKETDIIVFTRTFNFTQRDSLETKR